MKSYKIQNAVGTASFHGESWYKCPYCEKGFEFFQPERLYNDPQGLVCRCPHCNKIFRFKKVGI